MDSIMYIDVTRPPFLELHKPHPKNCIHGLELWLQEEDSDLEGVDLMLKTPSGCKFDDVGGPVIFFGLDNVLLFDIFWEVKPELRACGKSGYKELSWKALSTPWTESITTFSRSKEWPTFCIVREG